MSVNSISLKNLSFGFANKPLFNGLQLDIHAGEHTALLGANGAGKSTLLKLISGERQASQGEILIHQRQREAWIKAELSRHLAVLPQSSSLSFAFSVSEVVALGLINTKLSHQQQQQVIRQQLEMMDLWHYRDAPYPQLSGGEKQRVHYARVTAQLCQTPAEQQILLLDEPTSALDLSHQQELMQHASKLSAQGAAVVSVVHDLNLAARYCDRLLMLDQGEIFADGSPHQVLTAANVEQGFKVEAQIITHPEHGRPVMI